MTRRRRDENHVVTADAVSLHETIGDQRQGLLGVDGTLRTRSRSRAVGDPGDVAGYRAGTERVTIEGRSLRRHGVGDHDDDALQRASDLGIDPVVEMTARASVSSTT